MSDMGDNYGDKYDSGQEELIAMVISAVGTLVYVSQGPSKSLPEPFAAVVRQRAKELVGAQHDENVSAAAKAIGISQPMLSDFLNQKRGAGMGLLLALADHLNIGLDDLIGRHVPGRVVADDPLPERTAAANFARACGVRPDAIAEVLARPMSGARRVSPKTWLAMIESKAADLDEQDLKPGQEERPLPPGTIARGRLQRG